MNLGKKLILLLAIAMLYNFANASYLPYRFVTPSLDLAEVVLLQQDDCHEVRHADACQEAHELKCHHCCLSLGLFLPTLSSLAIDTTQPAKSTVARTHYTDITYSIDKPPKRIG